jgi:hypothetical protein
VWKDVSERILNQRASEFYPPSSLDIPYCHGETALPNRIMFKVTKKYLRTKTTIEGKVPTCACCGKTFKEGDFLISKTTCKPPFKNKKADTHRKAKRKRYCLKCARKKNVWLPSRKFKKTL